MQIQISWLLQKPTDLDLHCLQRQDISGFSRTRVNKCDEITIDWLCWGLMTRQPLKRRREIEEIVEAMKERDRAERGKWMKVNWLCWGLTTHQPLWVILCHLPEKRRRDRRDSRGDEREGQGRKRKKNESELTVLGFNDTSTLVGHFVPPPREREKRED